MLMVNVDCIQFGRNYPPSLVVVAYKVIAFGMHYGFVLWESP